MWVDEHLGREVEIKVDDTVMVVPWEECRGCMHIIYCKSLNTWRNSQTRSYTYSIRPTATATKIVTRGILPHVLQVYR